jgi:hypothetical protein
MKFARGVNCGDKAIKPLFSQRLVLDGGDEGDRTPGLSIANAALSQLSYIPVNCFKLRVSRFHRKPGIEILSREPSFFNLVTICSWTFSHTNIYSFLRLRAKKRHPGRRTSPNAARKISGFKTYIAVYNSYRVLNTL